jgi:hypothetical protein
LRTSWPFIYITSMRDVGGVYEMNELGREHGPRLT